jgi:hypothetical protein
MIIVSINNNNYLVSLDWCKGTSRGNYGFCHEDHGFFLWFLLP